MIPNKNQVKHTRARTHTHLHTYILYIHSHASRKLTYCFFYSLNQPTSHKMELCCSPRPLPPITQRQPMAVLLENQPVESLEKVFAQTASQPLAGISSRLRLLLLLLSNPTCFRKHKYKLKIPQIHIYTNSDPPPTLKHLRVGEGSVAGGLDIL